MLLLFSQLFCNLLNSGILSNRSPNHPFVGCISISRLNRLLLALPFDVARCWLVDPLPSYGILIGILFRLQKKWIRINGVASFWWSFGPHSSMGQYRASDHLYHAPQFRLATITDKRLESCDQSWDDLQIQILNHIYQRGKILFGMET